ncbi:MAG: KEOPS complex subunit Cgi121 [Nitrososphaerota archaeon]
MLVSRYREYCMAVVIVDNIVNDPFEVVEKFIPTVEFSVQFIDPRSIYTYRQLIVGFMGAVDAYRVNGQRAKKFEVEFLLRFSGKTQINEAIEAVGYRKGDRSVCVCVFMKDESKIGEVVQKIAEHLGGTISEEIERGTLKNVLELYGISINELEVLAPSREVKPGELLILERIAMSGLA